MDKDISTGIKPIDVVKSFSATDHLANERTFLAWIRTGLGIMAFGFVVERFSLFLKQFAYFFGFSNLEGQKITDPALQGYSAIFGVLLVAFGTILSILAFVKFIHTENQIKAKAYKPSAVLDSLLIILVTLMGIFLVVYLFLNNAAIGK